LTWDDGGWWKALLICADIAFLDSFDNTNNQLLLLRRIALALFSIFLNYVLAFPLSTIQEL
jgi:hypothetical protein